MKLKYMFLVAAAALACAAASVQAQTVRLAIIGSSALYQEMGQAAFAQNGCVFINTTKGFTATDSRGSGATAVSLTDTAAAWVAWTTGGGTCAAPGATSTIDFELNTDSVVGNRCFFASPSCSVATNASFSATCGTALPGTTCTNLPTAISNAINASGAGTRINVAATDIRPEDAKFATNRALTSCGTPIVAGSQYLGLGQQTANPNQGNPFSGATWTLNGFALPGGSFNVGNFNISGNDPASGAVIANGTGNTWVVIAVGATPQLVFVNPSNPAGLGSLAVNNVTRATLAGFLDGTYGDVTDLVPQLFSTTSPVEVPVNTVIREPLSGTYNTMEYAIPNDVENQSSQDIGLAAVAAHNAGLLFPPFYCTAIGGTWLTQAAPNNPLQETQTNHVNVTGATRSRAIGTGNVVKTVESVKDALGYAFWSQANFSSATPGNAKYLTVDGVDPIQEVWSDGEIPTSSNGLLGNVSFSHVKDGSYPIWSILRMVTNSANSATLTGLTNAAKSFVTPDFPDFVLGDQLLVVRSHFSPPGVTYPGNAGAPSNGSVALSVEAGGDVGGLVYSIQADNDYAADSGTTTGNVGHRQ